VGRWFPRPSLGGFPIRFPHPDEPGDTGWHVEGSYLPDGAEDYWVNLRSRDRALLMLFLFSDVGQADAPTRIKVGSHLDVPPFLLPAGEDGMPGGRLAQILEQAGKLDVPDRPLALATGAAGDVYLCHPFLVHAAQPHHGRSPRFMAQPPLHPRGLLDLDRPDGAPSRRPAPTTTRRWRPPARPPTARSGRMGPPSLPPSIGACSGRGR
jgi:hypothetical protein